MFMADTRLPGWQLHLRPCEWLINQLRFAAHLCLPLDNKWKLQLSLQRTNFISISMFFLVFPFFFSSCYPIFDKRLGSCISFLATSAEKYISACCIAFYALACLPAWAVWTAPEDGHVANRICSANNNNIETTMTTKVLGFRNCILGCTRPLPLRFCHLMWHVLIISFTETCKLQKITKIGQ